MPKAKLVITDFITGDLSPELNILGDLATVEALDAYNEDQLVGRIEDADAIMLYHNLALSRRTIERLTRCRLIVRCGVGVDNIDRDFAKSRGIPVANVPDYGTEEVADSAIGLTLAMTRGIAYLNSKLRDGTAEQRGPWMYTQVEPLHRLRGRVFACVGMGRIGTATALRAKALGMDVLFYDPYLPDGWDKAIGVRRAESIEELLRNALVLSLHCPLTPETRHMINAARLALLPRGAYLVNTARGAVVDTAALPAAIASGQLAGAGIDVLEGEPPRADDALVNAWRNPGHACHHRVIINPHSAFYSVEGLMDMRVKGSHACRRAILGETLRNVVNM
ncbi:MAG: C-terminal binding protein [Planctomycetes bacterium]|nr:C-terminal binding protein [Planctomycetota bacterium]